MLPILLIYFGILSYLTFTQLIAPKENSFSFTNLDLFHKKVFTALLFGMVLASGGAKYFSVNQNADLVYLFTFSGIILWCFLLKTAKKYAHT